MTKYNKNLYNYALEASGGKTVFGAVSIFFKYTAYTYMLSVLTIMVIGFSVVYSIESGDAESTMKLVELRKYIVWMSIVLVSGIAGLVFSFFKKYVIEFVFTGMSALLNMLLTIGLFNEAKHYLFRHFFPSLLVLIFITYTFAKTISKRKKVKKIYEELSNKLYRAAVAKKSDGIVSSAEHEKMMDEYKGGPIKIEYKK